MALFTRKIRNASFFLILSLMLFVVLECVAMARYPGGTWFDRTSVGHDFFWNFFCDLTASKALNGEPNPGAIFAQAGMLVLTLGFLPFWILVTSLVRTFREIILALGILSSLAAALVPFISSQEYGHLHSWLVFLASIPGVLAGGLSTYGLVKMKTGSRIPARLAVLTVVLVALDAALYAINVKTGYEIHPIVVPGLQKIATASLVAWMFSAAIFGRGSK
jgi:hypothetical protein